jgi:HNH endonuclease
MKIEDYLQQLPAKRTLSEVKMKILRRLWASETDTFPKPWVSSAELLELTGQKYFDRRIRELRDQLGCALESAYREEHTGHAWRLRSAELTTPQDRDYLTQSQKTQIFQENDYRCVTCGVKVPPGIRGLQADHKIPLSRGGSKDLANWQPMCNNCNVGKRRACEGCTIDCQICSWAFPEKHGVKTILSISEKTLRRVADYSIKTGKTSDKIVEESVGYYLDAKDSE